MAILGIHHAALIVPDLEQALVFYKDALGFEVIEEANIEPSAEAEAILQLNRPSAKSVILKSNWGYLELFEYLNPKTEPPGVTPITGTPVNAMGLRHICLAVDDCRAEHARLQGIMTFHCDPQDLGWGPGGKGPWVTYGRDPFGNIIELWELTADDPQLYAPISNAS